MVLWIYLVLAVFVLCAAVYLSFRNSYRLWDKCKVPHLKPNFPYGNFKEATKEVHVGLVVQRLYERLKEQGNYAGIYVFKKPVLLVTGPEFAKTVLVREFDTFTDRGLYYNGKIDPLSANLFFHEGNDWKILRQKLNPAFAEGKLEMMLHTLEEVTQDLTDRINASIGSEVDVKELMLNFIADVASSCVFGVEGDSKNISSAELRQAERRVMNFTRPKILMTLVGVFKDQARQIGFSLFDAEANDFFSRVVHQTIGFRRENNIHRHDLMQFMIELMRQDYESNEGLTIDEIVANSFMSFFMEFGTCSSTLTFALYNLAIHEDIQDAARKEVEAILKKFDGKFSYDAINDFELLDRIIAETLRQYPPVANVSRVATRNFSLPNGALLPKGTSVIVPVYAFHHDARIFPEPEKFDPNRFLDDSKSKRHPFAYLPFGEGPRICIGRRFAQMQTKLALGSVLRDFRVSVTPQTEMPLSIDNNAMTLIPRDQVWLRFDKVLSQ